MSTPYARNEAVTIESAAPLEAPQTIREARLRLGLSAAQLGGKIGATAAYIRTIERRGCPCHKTADRLARLLGCNMFLFLPNRQGAKPASVSPESSETQPECGGTPPDIVIPKG